MLRPEELAAIKKAITEIRDARRKGERQYDIQWLTDHLFSVGYTLSHATFIAASADIMAMLVDETERLAAEVAVLKGRGLT